MPWHGNHGWDSHISGLRTRYDNGKLTPEGFAKALEGFAARYEDRAARMRLSEPEAIRRRDLAIGQRLREEAAAVRAGTYVRP